MSTLKPRLLGCVFYIPEELLTTRFGHGYYDSTAYDVEEAWSSEFYSDVHDINYSIGVYSF